MLSYNSLAKKGTEQEEYPTCPHSPNNYHYSLSDNKIFVKQRLKTSHIPFDSDSSDERSVLTDSSDERISAFVDDIEEDYETNNSEPIDYETNNFEPIDYETNNSERIKYDAEQECPLPLIRCIHIENTEAVVWINPFETFDIYDHVSLPKNHCCFKVIHEGNQYIIKWCNKSVCEELDVK